MRALVSLARVVAAPAPVARATAGDDGGTFILTSVRQQVIWMDGAGEVEKVHELCSRIFLF